MTLPAEATLSPYAALAIEPAMLPRPLFAHALSAYWLTPSDLIQIIAAESSVI